VACSDPLGRTVLTRLIRKSSELEFAVANTALMQIKRELRYQKAEIKEKRRENRACRRSQETKYLEFAPQSNV